MEERQKGIPTVGKPQRPEAGRPPAVGGSLPTSAEFQSLPFHRRWLRFLKLLVTYTVWLFVSQRLGRVATVSWQMLGGDIHLQSQRSLPSTQNSRPS